MRDISPFRLAIEVVHDCIKPWHLSRARYMVLRLASPERAMPFHPVVGSSPKLRVEMVWR